MTLREKCPLVREIFESHKVTDEAGTQHELRHYLLSHFAEALYRTVLARRPSLVIETGMANGVSTLAILTALEEIGEQGRLISIDPFQASDYWNCGLVAVRRAGLAARHQLIERPSHLALPQLLASNTRVDLAYIDGDHRVDFVLLDFWYLDRMLPVGGAIAFNDCQMDSVNKVITFLTAYRRYAELDVGLPYSYVGYTRVRGLIRRLKGVSAKSYFRNGSDRYFEKKDDWEPPHWSCFTPF
jgi:predicted O-methyltransferase YrrM